MANVVTAAGKLTCSHSGTRTLSSSAKLTVSGQAVVPYSAAGTAETWSACTFTTPAGSPQPCATTSPVAQGQAGKLTAGSQPVLLDNLSAQTENPPNTVTVTAGQQKLTAS